MTQMLAVAAGLALVGGLLPAILAFRRAPAQTV